MAVPEALLAARARGAYERGRVRAALPTVSLVLPMTVLSLVACGRQAAPLACGIALAAVLLGALWRGQDYARGARTGLLAGLAPFLVPLGPQCTGHVCVAGACLLCPAVCIAAGVAAGIAVALVARRRLDQGGSWSYVASALGVAALAGSLGCVMAGTAGVVGMAGGMAAGITPLLLRPFPAGR